jgi:hypothetical protein
MLSAFTRGKRLALYSREGESHVADGVNPPVGPELFLEIDTKHGQALF